MSLRRQPANGSRQAGIRNLDFSVNPRYCG
jgi:hypothetical protein